MNNNIIGLDKNNLQLTDHHPQWSVLYVKEAASIINFLGDAIIQIDHFGSTSIPGIKAKPVIDILIQTADGLPKDTISAAFSANGYQMKSFPERKEKLFHKDENGLRLYNAHLVKCNSQFAEMLLLFRDTLRTNAVLAQEYEAIKIQEALKNPHDTQAYYNAKKYFFKKAIGWDY